MKTSLWEVLAVVVDRGVYPRLVYLAECDFALAVDSGYQPDVAGVIVLKHLLSVYPVFDLYIGDTLEIFLVLCYHCHIVDNSGTANHQV